MQRVPVPIFDHVCAGCKMGVNDQPRLSGILRVPRARVPSDGLRIRFGHQIIGVLEGPAEIA